jgi:integrase
MPKQLTGETKDGYQKRGNKWSYRYSVKDPITKRMKQVRISGFRTKEEAKADRIRRELEAQEGRYVSKSTETIKTFFTFWFQYRQDSGELKFSTIQIYKETLNNYIYPKIGEIELQEITSEFLEDFLISLVKSGGGNGRALSNSTVQRVITVLSSGLELAVRRKKIAFNPMKSVKTPKGRIKPVIAYTKEEVKLLLNKAKDNRLYSYFDLACHTGARRGELCALRWSDFNSVNQTISINKTRGKAGGIIYEVDTTKNKKGMRVIEIPLDTVNILNAHRERQQLERMVIGNAWQDTGYIFTTEDGLPINPAMPYNIFKRFIKELNLRDEPLHVLRHTHTTELLRAGVPAHVVAFRIGDEVATIQQTYAHVIAKDDRNSADIFAERIKSA